MCAPSGSGCQEPPPRGTFGLRSPRLATFGAPRARDWSAHRRPSTEAAASRGPSTPSLPALPRVAHRCLRRLRRPFDLRPPEGPISSSAASQPSTSEASAAKPPQHPSRRTLRVTVPPEATQRQRTNLTARGSISPNRRRPPPKPFGPPSLGTRRIQLLEALRMQGFASKPQSTFAHASTPRSHPEAADNRSGMADTFGVLPKLPRCRPQSSPAPSAEAAWAEAPHRPKERRSHHGPPQPLRKPTSFAEHLASTMARFSPGAPSSSEHLARRTSLRATRLRTAPLWSAARAACPRPQAATAVASNGRGKFSYPPRAFRFQSSFK